MRFSLGAVLKFLGLSGKTARVGQECYSRSGRASFLMATSCENGSGLEGKGLEFD